MQETCDIKKFEDLEKTTELLQKGELRDNYGSIVRKINLSAAEIRPETREQESKVRLLFEAIASNRSIIYLAIQNTDDKPPTHEIIINSLINLIDKNSTLQSLFLIHSKLSDQNIEKLAIALRDNRGIKELNLRVNLISDNSASTISETLETNKHLKILHLGTNRIGSDGAKALAYSLTKNSSLKKLHLGGNQIGDEGCIAIAEALKTNSCLETLYLNNNQITASGFQYIIEALIENLNLKTLEGGFFDPGIERMIKFNKLLFDFNYSEQPKLMSFEDNSEERSQTVLNLAAIEQAKKQVRAFVLATTRKSEILPEIPSEIFEIVSKYSGFDSKKLTTQSSFKKIARSIKIHPDFQNLDFREVNLENLQKLGLTIREIKDIRKSDFKKDDHVFVTNEATSSNVKLNNPQLNNQDLNFQDIRTDPLPEQISDITTPIEDRQQNQSGSTRRSTNQIPESNPQRSTGSAIKNFLSCFNCFK